MGFSLLRAERIKKVAWDEDLHKDIGSAKAAKVSVNLPISQMMLNPISRPKAFAIAGTIFFLDFANFDLPAAFFNGFQP